MNIHFVITPVQVPKCFTFERREELKYRKETMDEILEKIGFLEEPQQVRRMSEMEAVLLIQAHERARQGRLRAQFMKEIKLLKEKNKPSQIEKEETDTITLSMASAVRIQKIWRGYMTRR